MFYISPFNLFDKMLHKDNICLLFMVMEKLVLIGDHPSFGYRVTAGSVRFFKKQIIKAKGSVLLICICYETCLFVHYRFDRAAPPQSPRAAVGHLVCGFQ